MPEIKRVGILIGAFDPIHAGHVRFALEALQAARLDKVFFLVEPHPRHKQGVKALQHRVAMVKLALRAQPRLGVVVLERLQYNVPEIWPQLEARFIGAQLVMVLGVDAFRRLSRWPYLSALSSSTELVIGTHGTPADVVAHIRTIEHSRHVRLRYQIFMPSAPHINNIRIRHELRTGRNPEGLHGAVRKYIEAHQLYYESSSE